MKVTDLFHQRAAEFSDAVAIYDDIGCLSYKDLSILIKEAVSKLKNSGVQPGDRIGVQGGNSRSFIILMYAVMECDAAAMPLSLQLKGSELNEIIALAGLNALLSESTIKVLQNDLPAKEFNCAEALWRITILPNTNAKAIQFEIEPAFIRFTSGTTGTAKGVVLSHQSIIERISAVNNALHIGSDDRILWVLPMAYHFVVSVILYLNYGAGIIICNDFMASRMLDVINKYKATILYLSPLHIRLLSNDAGKIMIDSARLIISTSTSISKEECELFLNRYQKNVTQAYGIIEVGLPVINFKSYQDPDAIGFAVEGYTVVILDDNLVEVINGITGNLAMRGPGMLDAYLTPPQSRNEILVNGWFMTGDLASKTDDGLITIMGRKKSMINVAGNKVFPEEVEIILNRHPAVLLSRVSGYRHRLLGESVLAELVVKDGIEQPDAETIRTFCAERLSVHKIPQKIVFVDSIALTGSGKIAR